jgi:hypothetical protein
MRDDFTVCMTESAKFASTTFVVDNKNRILWRSPLCGVQTRTQLRAWFSDGPNAT